MSRAPAAVAARSASSCAALGRQLESPSSPTISFAGFLDAYGRGHLGFFSCVLPLLWRLSQAGLEQVQFVVGNLLPCCLRERLLQSVAEFAHIPGEHQIQVVGSEI